MRNSFLKGIAIVGAGGTSLLLGSFAAHAFGVPHEALPIAGALFALGQIPVQQSGVLMMGLNAKNILWAQGRLNPGGVGEKFYYAFEEDILSYPKALTVDTEAAQNFADLVTVPAGDPFIMKPGKYFFEHYTTLEEGELKSTMAGVRDSMSFENEFDFSFPGNEAEQLGFLASSANRSVVGIVPEQNGKLRIIGGPFFPGTITAGTYTSGKKVADGRANKMTIKASCGTPPAIYLAPVPLEPDAAASTAAAIVTQPAGLAAAIGQNVEIKVVAANAQKYTWYKDGAELAGIVGDQLTFLNIQAAEAGTYKVMVTGLDNGTVTSADAVLIVA